MTTDTKTRPRSASVRGYQFNEWQVERIRSRLNAYKNGYRGKKRSLKTVLYDILTSDVTVNELPIDGSEPEFKEEALRRFANGTNKGMELDKLADVRDFLIDKQYLSQAELDESPYDLEEVLNVQRYYTVPSSSTKNYLMQLVGSYVAERAYPGMTDRIRITARHDKKHDFLHVEECHERLCDPDAEDAPFTKKDGYVSFNRKRRGYGLVCLPTSMIYMLVRGSQRDDLISYVQAGPYKQDIESYYFYFLRNGVKYIDPEEHGDQTEKPYYAPYIFTFKSQGQTGLRPINEGETDG